MKILLIDGNHLAHRAFYAYQKNANLTNGCIFGSFSIIKNLFNLFDIDSAHIFWDVGGITFRHKLARKCVKSGFITSQYKVRQHGEDWEEVVRQMIILQENMHLINIRSLGVPGVEADDLIGSYIGKYDNGQNKFVVVSGDRDFFQLISKTVSFYFTGKKKLYTHEVFKDEFNIDPRFMIDVGALTGDSGDSIQGIKGIGPKTAIKLMNKYSDLKTIFKNKEELKSNKDLKKVYENENKIKIAYILKKIKKNLDFNFILDEYKGVSDPEKLKQFFNEFQFKSFLKNFDTEWLLLNKKV